MSERLTPQVAAALKALAVRHPAMRFPFIVTLAPGAELADVIPFKPSAHVATTRLVSGEMTAAQALALAKDPRVQAVAYDGTAEAIDHLVEDD